MNNDKQKIAPPSIFIDSIKDKLVSNKQEGVNNKNISTPTTIALDDVNMNDISNNTITNLSNNDSVLELFPDTELTMDIITSSIISPKDLLSTSLMYRLNETHLPLTTSQQILTTIEEHNNLNYKLEENLETIVKESLFTKGAYIEAIIPERTLTKFIQTNSNVGLEDNINTLCKENTIIGNDLKTEPSEKGVFKSIVGLLENDMVVDDYLTFTDNMDILSIANIIKRKKINKINQSVIGLEENNDEDVSKLVKLDNAFRSLKETKTEAIVDLDINDGGESKSIPMVMKLPVESVIPIHALGDTSDHIGYFVMLDSKGVPITSTNDWFNGSDGEIADLYKNTILNKINKELKDKTSRVPILNNLDNLYENIIEKRLKKIINDSDELKDIADIKEIKHVYRLMLTRVLKKKKTRLLFLPASVVQYYAFEYRKNGTGKSLLEKIGLLASIRAILLFGKLMATIKNSIPTTKYTVDLDPNDPDPVRTKERIIAETLKNKQLELPVGLLNVHDLSQWVHKVGNYYEINHDDLPNIKIDISDVNRSIQEPESDLEEDIRNRMLMTLGITPELVEAGISSDFATTIITNNALLARRIQKRQIVLQKHLSEHNRKIINCDGILREKIEVILKRDLTEIKKDLNKKIELSDYTDDFIVKYLIKDVSDNIAIKLPGIEITSEEGLTDSFNKYKDALETALESVLGSDAISSELASELGDRIDDYKNTVFHTLLKKWMSDNNYMPELNNLFTMDDEGNMEFDTLTEHEKFIENLLLAMKPILKDNKKIKKKIADIYEKYESEEEETETVEENTEDTPTDDTTPPDESEDVTEEETPEEAPVENEEEF